MTQYGLFLWVTLYVKPVSLKCDDYDTKFPFDKNVEMHRLF